MCVKFRVKADKVTVSDNKGWSGQATHTERLQWGFKSAGCMNGNAGLGQFKSCFAWGSLNVKCGVQSLQIYSLCWKPSHGFNKEESPHFHISTPPDLRRKFHRKKTDVNCLMLIWLINLKWNLTMSARDRQNFKAGLGSAHGQAFASTSENTKKVPHMLLNATIYPINGADVTEKNIWRH